MAQEAANKVEAGKPQVDIAAEKPLIAEEEPTLWETVKGVIFVLGVAAALTFSFAIVHTYEMAFTRVSYSPQSALATTAAEQQREREKQSVTVTQKDFLVAPARTGTSHVLAA